MLTAALRRLPRIRSAAWVAAAGLALWPAAVADDGPKFRETAVHDPSIVRADGRFYVFGSHLAAARSDDLLAWERFADGTNEANPLFENVREELRETFEWAETRTLWAPDVVRLRNGKFAMYYCGCKGDAPRSALGLALADRIEGPYRDQGILLKSGMWGQPSEDGRVYDPRIHPNAIDPSVFYDPEGRLWMVYGSYSGGIFILRLDPDTGRPLPGQGYGRHLTGGNHARIEGAYILHAPETGHYHLYVTFGGLDSRGGYNVRVARSTRPDGPYVDARGRPMADAKSDPALPLFDDRSIEPYGTKLMGNFHFPTAGAGHGYLSPGHNSAFRDPATGRSFLVFHTRFPGRGEQHEVRVHEIRLNRAGWPVVAPYRWEGRANEPVRPADVPGRYRVVDHGRAISAEVPPTQELNLAPGGRVSGAHAGTWRLEDGGRLRLDLGGAVYDGFALRQWQPETGRRVVTLTLLSADGLALWGVPAIGEADAKAPPAPPRRPG